MLHVVGALDMGGIEKWLLDVVRSGTGGSPHGSHMRWPVMSDQPVKSHQLTIKRAKSIS